MQSRMEKYQTNEQKKYERTRKNTKLYEDVYDDIYRDTTYQNMKVIDSAKEINIDKLKNIIDDNYDTRQYRTIKNYSLDDLSLENSMIPLKRQKVYDINEIINEAKNKRTFIEEAKEKQKYLNFKEQRKYDEYENLKKEDKELTELINTITIPKQRNSSEDDMDLFSDLKGDENTIVTEPVTSSFEVSSNVKELDKEKTNIKADKTFYTDSNMFTKNDFEDFNTLTKELKSSNKIKIIIIIIILLAILSVVSYYVITKFIIK